MAAVLNILQVIKLVISPNANQAPGGNPHVARARAFMVHFSLAEDDFPAAMATLAEVTTANLKEYNEAATVTNRLQFGDLNACQSLLLLAVDLKLGNPRGEELMMSTSDAKVKDLLRESQKLGDARHNSKLLSHTALADFAQRTTDTTYTQFMENWRLHIDGRCGLTDYVPTTMEPVFMALAHSKRVASIFLHSLSVNFQGAHQFIKAAMEDDHTYGINQAIASLAVYENNPQHVKAKVRPLLKRFETYHEHIQATTTIDAIFTGLSATTNLS